MLLQPGEGRVEGEVYVASRSEDISWRFLPGSAHSPVATVASGTTATFDTISHEGMLEDQGRDRVAWFAARGVAPGDVLRDATALAASGVAHRFTDGPHAVTGPVRAHGDAPRRSRTSRPRPTSRYPRSSTP